MRGTRSAYALRPIRAAVFFLHRLTGVHELRKRVRPIRAECFPLRFSEGVALCGAREFAAPAAGAKRKDNLRFSFLFELLPFPCLLARRRLPTCDRCEIRERQRIFSTVSFSTCSQCQIPYCYTGRLLLASATCPCRATGTHVITHGTCECRRSAAFILVGPVCNNAPKNCAALSCRALRI